MGCTLNLNEQFQQKLSRRELIRAAGVTGMSLATVWALACQPSAPAATPTTAPAAPVAPTATKAAAPAAPTATTAPAATPTEEKIGKHLIGKLEGPPIITDPAKWPKAFKEAPELADLVKAGKLPAAKERIGEDPLVLQPIRETGKYGGTWRRGFTGPGDAYNMWRSTSGADHILFWDYTGDVVTPNIAKGWEVSDGGKTITVFLRRGMKWSDGQPFTADDFKFWYEDLFQNKNLTPAPTFYMTINFKFGSMEFPDKYTVRWKFPEPYYLFVEVLAGRNPVGRGHAHGGRDFTGSFAPAHYVKQFHAKYVSKEELDSKVKEAKFDNWVTFLKFKNDWVLNPECPTVAPWVTKSPINTPLMTQERNPYSVFVDAEGNQLPYIDKVAYALGENLEVVNLRAIAGEYDWQERHLDMMKIPVLLANQTKGDYKVYLDPGDFNDLGIKFNLSYKGDPEIAKWTKNADFRRALSLGIERNQLNETFWLGLGTVSSGVPADGNKYFPGPEYRTLWATYDLKKANEMLDKIGLDKKDAEGYRLRTDGKGRLQLELATRAAQQLQYGQMCEMVAQQWKKIGIFATVAEMERTLIEKRQASNELQTYVGIADAIEHMFLEPGHLFPSATDSQYGPLWGLWFVTGGEKGEKPDDPRMLELMEKFRKAFGVPEAEGIKLGKEIWKIVAEEVYIIGTVGMSPAMSGVRVVKTKMGNVPFRMTQIADTKTPSCIRPVTLYWKS